MNAEANISHRQILEVSHVARMLRVTTRAVRKWITKGLLRARRRGIKIWIFDRADVLDFAARRGMVLV